MPYLFSTNYTPHLYSGMLHTGLNLLGSFIVLLVSSVVLQIVLHFMGMSLTLLFLVPIFRVEFSHLQDLRGVYNGTLRVKTGNATQNPNATVSPLTLYKGSQNLSQYFLHLIISLVFPIIGVIAFVAVLYRLAVFIDQYPPIHRTRRIMQIFAERSARFRYSKEMIQISCELPTSFETFFFLGGGL